MSRMSHIAPESWPGLAEHLRASFTAEQTAERERLKSQQEIEFRQRPENQSTASGFAQFSYYGFRR